MTRRLGTVLALALVVGVGGAVRATAAPEATAVLDKAIQALGGAEKLGKVKAVSWTAKGTLSVMSMDFQFTSQSTVQGLDYAKLGFEGDFGGQQIKAMTVLAGAKGWREFGGQRMDLDRASLASEKQNVYLDLVPMLILPLKGKEFKLGAVSEESIGGKPAVTIKATGPDGKDFTISFDQGSGLPIREVAKVLDFMGEEFTQEVTFSEFRPMGGIQVATKVQAKRNGEKFIEQQVTEFKVVEPADPNSFVLPQ
jgi:hypothetical protein